MHPSCQSLLVQRTKTMALRRSHHRRSGRALARYLPETAQRVASRRPTANLWTATLTCAAVWAREVLRGLVNHPSINGKDGVAGSIPAGGSTPNQQLRPGTTPGLSHAWRAPNRSLPAICQQITKRGRMNTIRGDRLERFAV
jgi:hypothetical protein